MVEEQPKGDAEREVSGAWKSNPDAKMEKKDESKKSRSRSRSREKGQGHKHSHHSRHRSRSRSRSHSPQRPVRERRQKKSGWDALPEGGVPGAAAFVPQPPTVSSTNLQRAKKLYVGSVPPDLTEQELTDVINAAMANSGLCSQPGNPVASVQVNPEKAYAFVEFRTAEEATAGLVLDGTVVHGHSLRFKRLRDYQAPSLADAQAELFKAVLVEQATGVPLGAPSVSVPKKVYIGGIPPFVEEEQLKELVAPFGAIKALDLIRDAQTHAPKGFAFCEFMESEAADRACEALNGLKLGSKNLVVQPAASASKPPKGSVAPISSVAAAAIPALIGLTGPGGAAAAAIHALPPALLTQFQNPPASTLLNLGVPAGPMISTMVTFHEKEAPLQPTPVLALTNMASNEELNDGEFYAGLIDDVRDECTAHGKIVTIHVPRVRRRVVPGHHQLHCDLRGAGRVFVEFESAANAESALRALSGRRYNGRAIMAKFISLEEYHSMVEQNEAQLAQAHERYLVELRQKQEEAAAAAMAVDPSKRPNYYLTGTQQLSLPPPPPTSSSHFQQDEGIPPPPPPTEQPPPPPPQDEPDSGDVAPPPPPGSQW